MADPPPLPPNRMENPMNHHDDQLDAEDAYAIRIQTDILAEAARPDFQWAIGGDDPDAEPRIETEYAIEPERGACARDVSDYLDVLICDLSDFRAEARLLTREVMYGPWRYVTPDEIRGDGK